MADNVVISPTQFFLKTLGNTGITQDLNRQYLFRVALPNIGNNTNQVEMISYFISSSGTPVETTGMIPVDWQNSQTKIAGRTLYPDPWLVNVKDDRDGKSFGYFKAWKELVYSANTGQSLIPRAYKFDLDLFLLDNAGNASRSYTLKGAWVNQIGSITLEYATEAIIVFPINLYFDDFISKTL